MDFKQKMVSLSLIVGAVVTACNQDGLSVLSSEEVFVAFSNYAQESFSDIDSIRELDSDPYTFILDWSSDTFQMKVDTIIPFHDSLYIALISAHNDAAFFPHSGERPHCFALFVKRDGTYRYLKGRDYMKELGYQWGALPSIELQFDSIRNVDPVLFVSSGYFGMGHGMNFYAGMFVSEHLFGQTCFLYTHDARMERSLNLKVAPRDPKPGYFEHDWEEAYMVYENDCSFDFGQGADQFTLIRKYQLHKEYFLSEDYTYNHLEEKFTDTLHFARQGGFYSPLPVKVAHSFEFNPIER